MKITLSRIFAAKTYTIGRLSLDGEYFCDTLEPTDRGLDSSMTEDAIRKVKAKGLTAIPTGLYPLTLRVRSQRLGDRTNYAFCGGRLPRLEGVPGYQGVLIHAGNYPEDTRGCVLVGRNLVKGQLLSSGQTLRALYSRLQAAEKRGATLEMQVTRLPYMARAQ